MDRLNGEHETVDSNTIENQYMRPLAPMNHPYSLEFIQPSPVFGIEWAPRL